MRPKLLTIVFLSASIACAADFEFYGRSGDAIELDFGSLPGVPAGATFSDLSVGRFAAHPLLSSTDLSQGDFSLDGRVWAFPNPQRNTASSGDTNPSERGYQGPVSGSLKINGTLKTFRVEVQPGYTGSGVGSVEQSLEGLGRTNNPLYVAQQRQRLAYFGYVPAGGGALGISGTFDNQTDESLRTFQAAFVGGVNTSQSNVDGIIGPNTAGWLNAANAPRWDELVDPDPQFPGTFSVATMIGDFDILPSFDPGGGGRTGLTPQIERFGTNWSIELFKTGSAAAKADTGITQLMNGMSTADGYGSSAFHSSHRAGMDIDIHVAYSTHNFGNGVTSPDEQGVIDTAIAYIDAGENGGSTHGTVRRIITSNEDILDGIRAARPEVSFYYDSSGGHRNHLHLDVGAPAQVAGMANLPGDFNLDGVVDAADYTVWRDGLGSTRTATDRAVWSANYGTITTARSLSIPEPATSGLVALALLIASHLRGDFSRIGYR